MKRAELKKQAAIEATLDLCIKHSFHGTSMDCITAATGMSKATIYRHFDSKEHLIKEALSLYAARSDQMISTIFCDPDKSLIDKFSFRFKVLADLIENDAFHGCYFQQAHLEYGGDEPSIADLCCQYKRERTEAVAELLLENDINRAKEKAQRAELVFNGLLAMLPLNPDIALIDLAKVMYLEQLGLGEG